MNIGKIVAGITPPELVAVRGRMAAIRTESEAVQAERDPIERYLNGGRNLTVDVRARLKGETASLGSSFCSLAGRASAVAAPDRHAPTAAGRRT